MRRFRWARHGFLLLAAGPLLACGGSPDATEYLGTVEGALSVCNETVPTNRWVDGIPAYDQCAASENSSIYSNNGVDTSTSAEGSDWVRTQWSGGYQCTELAHRYLYFRWDVDWTPNGNAGTWCDAEPPSSSGVVRTSTPVHGDVIVFPPGECGADSFYGHVALVDVVDSATRVTLVEQNRAGRRSTNISCAACFLHVVANDGSSQGSGGAAGAGGAQEATGGAPVPAGGAFPATGGITLATGGRSPGTGGAQLSTGGVSSAAGGARANTGGVLNGGSGAASSTGAVAASSGGAAQSTGGAAFGAGGVARGAGGASALPTGGTNPGVGGAAFGAGGAFKTGGTANAGGGSGATGADRDATAGLGEPDTGDSGAENTVLEATDTEEATDKVAGCGCRAAGSSSRTPGDSTHLGFLALASILVLGRRRSVRRRWTDGRLGRRRYSAPMVTT